MTVIVARRPWLHYTCWVKRAIMSFNEILEAADHLSLDEQATLLEVLQHRIVERRREALAGEVQQARREFEAGQIRPASPTDLVKTFLS